MRINPSDHTQDVATTEQVNRKQDKKAVQTSAPAQDGVKISPQLQERLAQTPEVRQDRIEAIKSARAAGTHNVSDSQLTDSLFKEFFNRG
jgi:anti-sigma28 factor (negative regulator of flagellin synthesis)